MKQLILDGYNVINKIPELRRKLEKNLRMAREALINYVVDRNALWGSEFKVTIVFDARKVLADMLPLQTRRGITIVFAEPPHDADEVIIQKLRQSKQTSSITVVTDDNRIANHVRAYEGKCLSVREFVAWIDKRKISPQSRHSITCSKKRMLDSVTSSDITEELEKLWK